MTSYRVIGFGEADYGFFNRFEFALDLGAALGAYQALEADPQMDGAVLIEVRENSWRVAREFGTEGVSVVCGPWDVFKVERVAELRLV